jgi:menaquinone-dependent protoporphyrinogen oxidase
MKALIVYGTRYGTASEIAEEIGKVMRAEGIEVNVVDAHGLKDYDVSAYDMVIIGSGIKMGKWTKDSLRFLKKNKSALADKKVALFVSCGAANEEKSVEMGRDKYLRKVAEENLLGKPVDMGLFGSVYDPNAKHGLMYKMTAGFIRKDLEKKGMDTSKRIDLRNWEEIQTWARGLADMIK